MKKIIVILLMYCLSPGNSLCFKPPTQKSTIKRIYPIAGALFAASFIPYFWEDDKKPQMYKDGLTTEQIKTKRKYKNLNRFLNGDIRQIHNVFPDFEILLDD